MPSWRHPPVAHEQMQHRVERAGEPTEAPNGDSGPARPPGTNAIKRSW
jgi:hypothetical protein